jgi:hypothetical protein
MVGLYRHLGNTDNKDLIWDYVLSKSNPIYY